MTRAERDEFITVCSVLGVDTGLGEMVFAGEDKLPARSGEAALRFLTWYDAHRASWAEHFVLREAP